MRGEVQLAFRARRLDGRREDERQLGERDVADLRVERVLRLRRHRSRVPTRSLREALERHGDEVLDRARRMSGASSRTK